MNKHARVEAVIVVTAFAAAVFLWTAVHALWFAPDHEIAAPNLEKKAQAIKAAVEPGDYPERLIVPALHIDAAVQRVGINQKGNMATPSNFTDVAWYKYGPVPGQVGSAVIDGHVDNGLSLSGVFKHLDELQMGDELYVQTVSGKRLRFIVTEIATYDYKNAPSERIFERDDAVRLNLITCDGDWVAKDKTYDERLVVYTELRK